VVTELLLDTNVTSELRRARHRNADPHFAQWASSVRPDVAYVSVITLHEMQRGALLVERRDPATATVYRAWLDTLREAFRGRILDLDQDAALLAATFHVPDPAPLADALIAATASTHGLTVATRNVADFERFGVPLLNPWERLS
jgi:predicted nucleic acid-binding protein